MGLFSKLAAKAVAKKSGENSKKFLLVCPNCGKKLAVRIEFSNISATGNVTYNVIDNQTGQTIQSVKFSQKQIKQYGQSIFNNVLGFVDCPECGITMTSSTTF